MAPTPRLQGLIDRLERHPPANAEQVARLVESFALTPADVLPHGRFDHPITDSYGRRAIAVGPHFEVMVMSWRPGDVSAIHDHGHAQWGAVMHFGPAEHFTYRVAGEQLVTDLRQRVRPGTISPVTNELIHQMGNPTDEHFCSLHVYGCPPREGSITGDARIFDLWERRIQRTDGGVFFCLPETDIVRREEGFGGDEETTYRHHQQMLARIDVMAELGRLRERQGSRPPPRHLAHQLRGVLRHLP